MKLKKILDGHGVKLKAIWGREIYYKDLHPTDFYDIIIETNKGTFTIGGCSNCEAVSFGESEAGWLDEIRKSSELS